MLEVILESKGGFISMDEANNSLVSINIDPTVFLRVNNPRRHPIARKVKVKGNFIGDLTTGKMCGW